MPDMTVCIRPESESGSGSKVELELDLEKEELLNEKVIKPAEVNVDADEQRGEAGEEDEGEREDEQGGNEEKSEEERLETAKADRVVDPIKWFGLLVPPALRSAQGNFKEVVDGTVTKLVNTDRSMERLEIEIRRTKKRMSKLGSSRESKTAHGKER